MLKRNDYRALVLSAALGLWAAPHAFGAYSLNTLATFIGANGAAPGAGLTLVGNTLYGTTAFGGAGFTGTIQSGYGTVFSVPITGGSITTLVTFNTSSGYNPVAGLTLSGNTFYGTTESETGLGYGTVFSLPVTGGVPTTLATFNRTVDPDAGLILSGGILYSTTYSGTVFSVPVTGGSPTTLATFGGSYGANPMGGLVLSGTTLYGTTSNGAAGDYGTVFSVPATGGSPTILATFNRSNGANSVAGLTLSGNTLYGTAEHGGTYSDGVVFSIPVTGGALTTVGTFTGSNGQLPQGGLLLLGNTFYGTTGYGGSLGDGAVFSVPISGGSPTLLASFTGSNGSYPDGTLIVSGNTLYGTTFQGGASGDGTVFSLTPNPIISLTAAAPSAFGSNVGTLTVTGSHGSYVAGSATFAATPTGYLAVSGFNPSTDSETYALEITDSTPANLAIDLTDAASEINAGTYTGYSVTASTTDPLSILGNGYDFYITITNNTLGTGSPYFGFDFTQLNGTTDTLSVTGVAAVPEPASLGLLAIAGTSLLRRRRRAH